MEKTIKLSTVQIEYVYGAMRNLMIEHENEHGYGKHKALDMYYDELVNIVEKLDNER